MPVHLVTYGGDFIADKQYTIGEFAALNKITPRMLRHYDKIGLLKPASVLENGYRAYTSAQIPVVSRIRLYQSCRFALNEIKELLCADETAVRRLAKEKMKQLRLQEQDEQFAWTELTRLSQAIAPALKNDYDISFVEQSGQMLFCCLQPVLEAGIETAIDSLYHVLGSVTAKPVGLLHLLSDWEENASYRVAVPVSSEIRHEGYECIHLDAAWYLSVFHYGDYYGIGMAYDKLLCCAAQRGYQLEMPFIERYFVDEQHTTYPGQYITQILIKITP